MPAVTTDPRPRDPQGRFDGRSGDTSSGDMKLAYGKQPGAVAKIVSKLKGQKPVPAHSPKETLVTEFSAESAAFASAKVDRDKRVVRGVSVITSGVSAIGHDMDTDDTTLRQMCDCANRRGKVKTKANHGKAVEEICGYLTNFRIEGPKLLADWHLLETYPNTAQFLEIADTIPGECGMSASFAMPDHDSFGSDGRKKARCTDLVSVDFVHRPAANPNGLFAAKPIDNTRTNMSDTDPNTQKKTEPTLADVLAAVQGLGERIDALEQNAAGSEDGATSDELEHLLTLSDEELAELGLKRADIEAALAGEGEGNEPEPEGDNKELAALEKRIARFEAKERIERRDAAADAIDAQITEFAEKVDGLTELNAKQAERIAELEAQNKAQAETLKKYGHKVVEFSAGDQGGNTPKKFLELAAVEVEKAKASGKTITNFEAQDIVRKANPSAFEDYRKELGVSK